MADERLSKRYATAVFNLAVDADAVGRVRDDLHVAQRILSADDETRRFFRSPVVERAKKANAVEQAFGSLHVIVLHTLLLLVRKRRENIFDELVTQFDLLEQRRRGGSPLRIESARELSPEELRNLVDTLSRRYSTHFDVTQSVDPALIGGVRITMGDKLIDGSVAGRLDELARLLSTN